MRRLISLCVLAACVDANPPAVEPPWKTTELLDGRRRLETSAAALGTRLVVLGGFATSDREVPRLEISREVLMFEPLRDPAQWSVRLPEAPEAWTHAALVSAGATLYLLGGLEGEQFVPSGKTYRLLANATAWEPLEPMPPDLERGAAAVVSSPGHVFLFGGATTAGVTATVLDYSIAENTWSELPALPVPRSHAAAMRDEGGTFIVAGGLGSQGEPLGDVYALPPTTNNNPPVWELREPMPTARGGCASGVVYGNLVCAGGEIGAMTTDVVEVYDPRLNSWHVGTPMPGPRAGAPGAIVSQRLYVVGGSETRAFDPTGSLFVFDLTDDPAPR